MIGFNAEGAHDSRASLQLLIDIAYYLGHMMHPVLEWAVLTEKLDIATIWYKFALITKAYIFITVKASETPFSRNDDKLTARELHFRTTQCLDDVVFVLVLRANGDQGLANFDTGNFSCGLAKSTAHTSLEPAFRYH